MPDWCFSTCQVRLETQMVTRTVSFTRVTKPLGRTTYFVYMRIEQVIAGLVFLNLFFVDMEFLEVLTEGLERVLLVRGGGREVITIYS